MIDQYEHLDLSELQSRLGEMQVGNTEETQNALIILTNLVRDLALEIVYLKTQVEHLESRESDPTDPALSDLVAQHARINEIEMWGREGRPGG